MMKLSRLFPFPILHLKFKTKLVISNGNLGRKSDTTKMEVFFFPFESKGFISDNFFEYAHENMPTKRSLMKRWWYFTPDAPVLGLMIYSSRYLPATMCCRWLYLAGTMEKNCSIFLRLAVGSSPSSRWSGSSPLLTFSYRYRYLQAKSQHESLTGAHAPCFPADNSFPLKSFTERCLLCRSSGSVLKYQGEHRKAASVKVNCCSKSLKCA